MVDKTSIRRAFASLAVALAVGTSAAVAVSGPAQAGYSCPDGSACGYEHASYGGRYVDLRIASDSLDAFGMGNRVSSLVNNSNSRWCWWHWGNYNGRVYRIEAKSSHWYVGAADNDQFDSAHVNTWHTGC